jgi:hypothetical protein
MLFIEADCSSAPTYSLKIQRRCIDSQWKTQAVPGQVRSCLLTLPRFAQQRSHAVKHKHQATGLGKMDISNLDAATLALDAWIVSQMHVTMFNLQGIVNLALRSTI